MDCVGRMVVAGGGFSIFFLGRGIELREQVIKRCLKAKGIKPNDADNDDGRVVGEEEVKEVLFFLGGTEEF